MCAQISSRVGKNRYLLLAALRGDVHVLDARPFNE